LCINKVTHEEYGDSSGSMLRVNPVQKTAIENNCKDLKIDIDKFLAVNTGLALDQLDTLSSNKSKDLLNLLNSYRDNEEEIPKEIIK